jgi:hypothetical protein
MVNIFLLLLLIGSYTPFIASLSSNRLSSSIGNVLKYKNYLSPKPIGELLNNIENHEVDAIYFSNDLDKVYSEKHHEYLIANVDELEDNDVLKDFSITTSSPILTNKIIELSSKNNVNSVILNKEVNPVNVYMNEISGFAGNTFNFITYPEHRIFNKLTLIDYIIFHCCHSVFLPVFRIPSSILCLLMFLTQPGRFLQVSGCWK